jgi:hypothetical protein
MEPVISIILQALAAGVQASATGIATDEVKHIYNELKALIQQKWTGNPSAEKLLSEYEKDPGSWEQILVEKLKQSGITQDERIVQKAEQLLQGVNNTINVDQNRKASPGDTATAGKNFSGVSISASQKQISMSRLSLENVRKYFSFLSDRFGDKAIELEVDSQGKKLKINVNSQQELDVAIRAAQDFISEGIPPGKILFDTPYQMKVGIPERVSIRITKKLTYGFFEDLIHTQEVEVENIRVSQFMAASLRGDDFKIEALGDEEQIIEDNDFTQWDWKIVPLKAGSRKLWASITIQVKVENEQARKTLPVLEKEINVRINPVYSTRTFVGQYWQWLIASAIIPIVGLLLKK